MRREFRYLKDNSHVLNPETNPLPGALNSEQQKAVVSEERRLLVLAGAGSGKTKTLLQKLVYLIEEKGVSPSHILTITFTKNATNEMIDRLILSADHTGYYQELLQQKGALKTNLEHSRYLYQKKFPWIDRLSIKTFHSFCYSVLRNFGVNEFDNRFRVIGDEKKDNDSELHRHVAPETVFEVMHKLLIERCTDRDYLLLLKRYILDYVVDKIHLSKPSSDQTPHDGKFYTTLDGTKVRSKSEQSIADWLYRHNIAYEYEAELNIKDFTFRPDFHIPAANLYLEHVSKVSYPMRNKEEQFIKGNLLFVRTFEEMTRDSALFQHTLDQLIRGRLPGKTDPQTALSYREEMNGHHDAVRDFVQQVIRVTDMMKVEHVDLEEIRRRGLSDQHDRVRSFYALALPLLQRYMSYCTDKSYLDFNDLISTSISLFRHHPDIAEKYRNQYRYIQVDEFQDVNNLQVELIKLMLTEQTQLFCVGDDWQSIYGFRGSNVGYIIEFEKHFPGAQTIKLNLNYRSTQHIVGASNEVIRHNKFKVEKDLRASKRSEHKIVVYAGNNEDDSMAFCVERVREFLDEGMNPEDILFLYRRSKMYSPYFYRFRKEGISVQAKTIHAAKGLEARVVFILGLKEGKGGFPDIWLEDRIFQVIKKADHDLLMEEERRLFYVAITRAKDKLFLITEKGAESPFLREIPETFTVRTRSDRAHEQEALRLCRNCQSQLEKLWVACPYCGEKAHE